jgi:hypothetical protein
MVLEQYHDAALISAPTLARNMLRFKEITRTEIVSFRFF